MIPYSFLSAGIARRDVHRAVKCLTELANRRRQILTVKDAYSTEASQPHGWST